jgi:hypothetical protein
MDTPLPMTDREWQDRLARSRQALGSWTWEASLPWADRNLMRTIAETEIAALRHYVPYMPVGMRETVAPLVHDWDDFRLSLLE